MLNKVEVAIRLLVISCLMFTGAAFACTAQERVKLLDAGYAKAEIEAMCVNQGVKLGQSVAVSTKPNTVYRPGQILRDCPDCPELVVIPSGNFLMGSPVREASRNDNEGPQHRGSVPMFALGKYEVTQGQWRAIMGSNPSYFDNCGGDCPVESVSWSEAQEFVEKLSVKTGKTYRLPSEAEWEYAARAGTTTPFYTGPCVHTDQANYDGHHDYNGCGAKSGVYRIKTVGVGSFAPNGFGLYDMIGNVLEWVEDCYNKTYDGAPSDGSTWSTGDCSQRVNRGGSWIDIPANARSAYRYWDAPSRSGSSLGFRVARTLP